MTGQYSCGTCKIEVKNEDELSMILCEKWNHVFCVDTSSTEYEKLKFSTLRWYCPIFAKEMHHFPVYPIKDPVYIQKPSSS